MAPRIDFTSDEFFRDPAAGIAVLRASGPVVATRFPLVGKVWVTTTYETTAQVLKEFLYLHPAQGRRCARGSSVVDAEIARDAGKQYAHHG